MPLWLILALRWVVTHIHATVDGVVILLLCAAGVIRGVTWLEVAFFCLLLAHHAESYLRAYVDRLKALVMSWLPLVKIAEGSK